MGFRKAERKRARIKMALEGSAGSGKTYSALSIAKGLGGKIALIDTERGASQFYADKFNFDILELSSHSPDDYVKAIKAAEAGGYDVIIIDSISHEWNAVLRFVESRQLQMKNKIGAWKEATPLHDRFVDSILQSPAHVIATMRVKAAWTLTSDDSGKSKPQKAGFEPVQREGLDYEFRLIFRINQDHIAFASKDNTNLFKEFTGPLTEDVGQQIREWLEQAPADPVIEDPVNPVIEDPNDEPSRPPEIRHHEIPEAPPPFIGEQIDLPIVTKDLEALRAEFETKLKTSNLNINTFVVRFKKVLRHWEEKQFREAIEVLNNEKKPAKHT